VLDLSAASAFETQVDEHALEVRLRLQDAALAEDISVPSVFRTVLTQLSLEPLAGGDVAVVLQLERAQALSAFTLKPEGQRGHRLVLDLTDLAAPEAAQTVAAVPVPEAVPATASSSSEPPVAEPTPPARRALPAPPPDIAGPAERFPSSGPEWRFSGTLQQEWAMGRGRSAQKFETQIEPRVDGRLFGTLRLTGIARIRLDTVGDLGPSDRKPPNYSGASAPWYNTEHAELSLRELYLDGNWGESLWRLGKQQVVWGQADGIKVLDVVNPQTFREFILDDFDRSRIPLWMINAEAPLAANTSLQVLLIPDRTYHELAEIGSPYEIRSNRLLPAPVPGLAVDLQEPRRTPGGLRGSDYGARLSSFAGGWDLTLNYLRHYQDFPVPYVDLELLRPGGPAAVVLPVYQRNHLFGATAANVFGSVTLRTELAYNTNTFHVAADPLQRGIVDSGELASVLGLDWRPGSETFISAQWFQSYLTDYRSSIERDRNEHNLSLVYRRSFANEVWDLNALLLYSANHGDSWLQLKLSYLWLGNVRLWLGADLFHGDRQGLFGQFRNEDRLLLGAQWSF